MLGAPPGEMEDPAPMACARILPTSEPAQVQISSYWHVVLGIYIWSSKAVEHQQAECISEQNTNWSADMPWHTMAMQQR